MIQSSWSCISTGRKIKGKGRGGKIPQGGQKGKIQFQGKKIKFENDEEDGENDTKTGMSFCALNAAYFLQKVAPCTCFSHLAVLCSISVLLTGSALRVLYSIPSAIVQKNLLRSLLDKSILHSCLKHYVLKGGGCQQHYTTVQTRSLEWHIFGPLKILKDWIVQHVSI